MGAGYSKFKKPFPYKRKPWRNRKRNKNRLTNLSRRSIVPYRYLTKMTYQDDVTLNVGAAGTIASQVYSLNGLYDPDVTGVGHQPRGFDQLIGAAGGSGLYHHYTCVGAKVQARVMNPNGSSGVRVGMVIRDTPSVLTSPNDGLERSKDTNSIRLGPAGGSNVIGTLGMKWSAKNWFGKPNVTTERDLIGSNTANPLEQAYLHIFADDPVGVDIGPIYIEVKIQYLVLCSVPLTPAQS